MKKVLSVVLVISMMIGFILPISNVFASTIPTITVKSGNTTFSNNGTYTLNAGDTINISATPDIAYIKYQIGTESLQIANSSNVSITVPNNLETFSLQVYAKTNEGIGSGNEFNYYTINVGNNSSEIPKITVRSGNTTFSNNGTYTINEGDKINISATPDIAYIKYKVGTESLQIEYSSNVSITVPSNTETFSLQVYAKTNSGIGSGNEFNYYNIKVRDNSLEVPTITTRSGNTTFSNNGTYTLNVGDKINISATPNIEYIKYKIGTEDVVTVNSSNVTLTVPDNLTTYSLQVYARGEGGTTGWINYNINSNNNNNVTSPILTVRSDDTLFKSNGTYELNAGDKINISATPNVEYIKYKVGTGDVVTVNNSNVTLTVPDDLSQYSLQVFVRAAGGTVDWQLYNIVVGNVNNTNYPVILQPDEKANTNLSSISISLRTIPLVQKDGNQNYFSLNENIQYNIDFINAGEKITGKVYIYFAIPDDISASFIDTKGGTVIDSRTVRWEFNGLDKGEKGTIPLILKYTSMNSNSITVKPYAKIETTYNSDISAVINYIYNDSSTIVNTNHKPFMIGDAGTNTFRPSEGVNRAEVAMILTRIFDLPLVTNYTVSYKDANYIAQKYGWAEQAIMTVTKYGLMEGYDDGEFKPADKVTKAQLITILSRRIAIDNSNKDGFNVKEQPVKLFNNLSQVYSNYGYTDHWASKYIAQMLRLNMIPEFKNTIDGNIDMILTRAEVARLISMMLLRGPSVDGTSDKSLTNTFTDVTTSTQYYQFILEASANVHNSKFSRNGVETMVK